MLWLNLYYGTKRLGFMSRFSNNFYLLLIVLTLSISSVLAHAPFGAGDNESLENATVISEPTKSWAIYGELREGGEAQYYKFDINQGETIYAMLGISTAHSGDKFTPGLVLMGPNLSSKGQVPDYVEVPGGVSTMVFNGIRPSEATYEAFTPSMFYNLVEVKITAPATGTYYLAVQDPSVGGRYVLAVGSREEFSVQDIFGLPLAILQIYQWEGQDQLVVLAPFIATIVLGLLLIFWRKGVPKALFAWAGILAGLFFLGSGVLTLFEMAAAILQTGIVSEVIITILFSLVRLILGVLTIRIALTKRDKIGLRTRLALVIMAAVAFIMWTGFYFGPVLAILTSVLPFRKR